MMFHSQPLSLFLHLLPFHSLPEHRSSPVDSHHALSSQPLFLLGPRPSLFLKTFLIIHIMPACAYAFACFFFFSCCQSVPVGFDVSFVWELERRVSVARAQQIIFPTEVYFTPCSYLELPGTASYCSFAVSDLMMLKRSVGAMSDGEWITMTILTTVPLLPPPSPQAGSKKRTTW